jgi:26S proteasome regulatory subunit N1
MAGTNDKEISEILGSILADDEEPIEILAFASLAIGQINVGTCDGDISSTIIQVLTDQSSKLKNTTLYRFISLGMGLLFLGSQDKADAIAEICRTLDKSYGLYAEQTIITCAYTGTGNVIQVQKLLKICGRHLKNEKKEEEKLAEEKKAEEMKKDEKEEKKEEKKEDKKVREELVDNFQGVATIGIAQIALGEPLGAKMATRAFDHLLQFSDLPVRRAVPLSLGLLNISNPELTIMDVLSKLSHDSDIEVAENAIFS